MVFDTCSLIIILIIITIIIIIIIVSTAENYLFYNDVGDGKQDIQKFIKPVVFCVVHA